MKVYKRSECVRNEASYRKAFSENVLIEINKIQSEGLEVEIQYQQSDKYLSALILGYEVK